MTDPAEVRASLLRGDSRDGCARRKVADHVREVVEHACDQVALAALAVGSPQLPHTQQAAARAASAVVLASDLRAPETYGPFDLIGRETEERIPAGAPMEVNPETGKVRVARSGLANQGAEVEHFTPAEDFAEAMKAAEADDAALESLVRESLRERLASVERLLTTYVEAVEIGDRDAEMGTPDGDVESALTIVRALLGGQ